MNIAITGASGYIGSRLTEKMSAGPNKLRCLVRDKTAFVERFNHPLIEAKECDLLKPETLSNKLENIDTAFFLVHSLASDNDFDEDEVACAQNFLNEAINSGVKRIIYLGGLTAKTDKISRHLSSRLRVGELLRSSSIECIEFQASIIIGRGGLSYEIMRNLVERLPAAGVQDEVAGCCCAEAAGANKVGAGGHFPGDAGVESYSAVIVELNQHTVFIVECKVGVIGGGQVDRDLLTSFGHHQGVKIYRASPGE